MNKRRKAQVTIGVLIYVFLVLTILLTASFPIIVEHTTAALLIANFSAYNEALYLNLKPIMLTLFAVGVGVLIIDPLVGG